MSGARRLLHDAAWLLGGRALSQVPLVLCAVILARRMGLAGFGHYAFVVALVYLANVVTTFGTDMVLIREVATDRRVTLWPAALTVQLALSALAIGGIWIAAPLIPGQAQDVAGPLRIYAWSLVPAAIYSVGSAVFRGSGRMRQYAILGFVVAGLQLAAVWLLVPEGAALGAVVPVLLAVQGLSAVLAWGACAAWYPECRRLAPVSRDEVVRLTQASARVGLLGMLGVTYQRLTILVLGVVAGPVGTAWYSAGSRVVDVSKSGHVALFGALYPTRAASHDRTPAAGKVDARDGWTWWLSVIGAVGIALVLALAGPRLIVLLYGSAFAPAGAAVTLLGVTLVPSQIANFQSVELLAARREGAAIHALVISLLVLVALLALLVPAVGWAGACWAVLAAETVQAVLLLRVTGRIAWSRTGRVRFGSRRLLEDAR